MLCMGACVAKIRCVIVLLSVTTIGAGVRDRETCTGPNTGLVTQCIQTIDVANTPGELAGVGNA